MEFNHHTFVGLGSLIFFLLVIGAIVLLIVVLTRRRPAVPSGPTPHHTRDLEELDLADAKGQISREEYFQRRADLTWSAYGGYPAAPANSPAAGAPTATAAAGGPTSTTPETLP